MASAIAILVVSAMFGPVSLSFLSARLESMVNAELDGLQVRFRDTTLDWSDASGRVNLTLVGARLIDKNGGVLAQAPRVAIALSPTALLQGRAVPRWIALDRPAGRITRDASGQILFGLTQDNAKAQPDATADAANDGVQTALLETMFDLLRHPEKGGDLSRKLEGIAVRGASLEIIDEVTHTRWAARDTHFELTRRSGALAAALKLTAMLPGQVPLTFEADATLPAGADAFHVKARSGDVVPAALAKTKGFAALAPLRFPVRSQLHFMFGKGGVPGPVQIWVTAGQGQLHHAEWGKEAAAFGGAEAALLFDANTMRGTLQRLTFKAPNKGEFTGTFALATAPGGGEALSLDIKGRQLSVTLPALFDGPFKLDALALAGQFGSGQVTIQKFSAALNTFRIGLAGAIVDSPISPGVTLDGRFTGLTVADLKTLWPKPVSPNARAWVTGQMRTGLLPQGTIKAALAPDAIVDNVIPNEGLEIVFDYTGLTADYLDGLPPLVDGRGRATLRGDTFEVTADSGVIGNVKLKNGLVFIPELHLRGTVAAISGEVSESMTDILTLLDAPRLGYPKRFGIKPASVKGAADVAFMFNVPTLKETKAEDVGIKVTGKTRDLAVRLNPSIIIEGANLGVDITGEKLVASGDARVNTVPMKLTWTEEFNPKGKVSTTVESDAVIDDGARQRLGLALQPYVEGPVQANARLTGSGASLETGTIMLNFDRARIMAPEINWAAGPGNKMVATAKLTLKPGGVYVMDQLQARGGYYSVAGRLVVDHEGIREAQMEHVRLGPLNDFAVVAKTPLVGEQKYVVSGRSIDASELIANMAPDPATVPPPKERLKKPYNITATLQQVGLRADTILKDVVFRNQTDGIRMKALDTSASFPGGGSLRADMVLLPDGQRRLRVSSTDAGKMIRAMTGFRSILGGAMTLNADLPRLPAPSHAEFVSDPAVRYSGAVKIENFKVIDQPFLARLFAAGSFTGLGDLLSGEGIGFTRLDGVFSGAGDVVKVTDGRAAGTSVGVTFQGKVDRAADRVDFDGTLVPLYGLNSMFEDIPLVGDILTSRKGEGIIGITYEVAGKSDNLDVMVNPLSALTPGIFRRIFQAGKYPDEGRKPPPAAAKPLQQPATAIRPSTN
jgi:hypothetical protein